MTVAWPADSTERRPIAASMAEFGVAAPALVDEAGVLIAGHGRIAAARLLGFAEYPVLVCRKVRQRLPKSI
jgi:ParB-like chromosome segregation protein Spo0J